MNDETIKYLEETIDASSDLFLLQGDVLVQRANTTDLVGTTAVFDGPSGIYVYPDLMMRMRFRELATAHWFWRYASGADGRRYFMGIAAGSSGSMPKITGDNLRRMPLPVPPLAEQRAVAKALADVDALLAGLDGLLAKKRDLKQAAMQQLLTGQTRLPGFRRKWAVKTLEEIAECLDDLRVPLNEAQRSRMRGDYPYCGANGVLDYIDRYIIDDDIILMAEDGGYFDEYKTRPIAYRLKGKCWVNNHAHILKAKLGFDQVFVYYSLVHKNILPFLANGTRAKLNKSEMKKIEIETPGEESEQAAIANILSDMDAEIFALEARREKTRLLKQAMMQELLTGKTRLVPTGEPDA
ncbi:restriction endonuclease subunit S [Paludibaculum fermentans]|uniref:Restriction endonuclease subunit S n=1 Tax=Paludibaculum fermentans TaxID=1473598 RepID=A0A7S7NM73_PALFE|nr:restriction endonuclease subunit S [Paludibaculum fermentans]QOY86158.1 restriction endonuclease subunit S [Paludibaculum fermentans]